MAATIQGEAQQRVTSRQTHPVGPLLRPGVLVRSPPTLFHILCLVVLKGFPNEESWVRSPGGWNRSALAVTGLCATPLVLPPRRLRSVPLPHRRDLGRCIAQLRVLRPNRIIAPVADAPAIYRWLICSSTFVPVPVAASGECR
jgi:hypothetical protein